MNPIPTYAELYDMILRSTEPYSKSKALYYAKRLVDAETAIDRLCDPSNDCDDLNDVYREKCKYKLKTLYRHLLSIAECMEGRESVMISQSDLAAVFGYHAHTMIVASKLYELLTEFRIIEPAGESPQRNTERLVWLLPPEQWRRPDNPGRLVL